jgi:hypothetical protein
MTGTRGTLLVINAGSSSIKFQLFDVIPPDGLRLAFRGQLEGIGSKPHLSAKDATGAILTDEAYSPGEVADVSAALDQIEGWLLGRLGSAPRAIGHRVVHGGPDFDAPILVDALAAGAADGWYPWRPSTSRTIWRPSARSAHAGRSAPGRVLRHRVPSRPSGCRPFRDRGQLVSGGCAPPRLSRPLLCLYRRPAA